MSKFSNGVFCRRHALRPAGWNHPLYIAGILLQADDRAAIRRLADLDGGRMPSKRMLVGELDGEVVAAVPIAGGAAVADPFRSTSALVSLLGLRAAQLRGLEDSPKRRGSIRRLFSGGADRRKTRTNRRLAA